ncbi:MAG: hypothetical protein U5R31_07405 [Acidimicrobiia bacterium]|nr:hypothetical protein [Acidimicrobiia bacterium]
MNLYADGVAAGPIPFEIDETGLGLWTLGPLLGGERRCRVPRRRVARRQRPRPTSSSRWRDPATGLPRPAFEDDNLRPPSPATLVSAAPALLGLRCSVARPAEALGRIGDSGPLGDPGRRARRRHRPPLPRPRRPTAPSAAAFGGADHLLWPARYRPPDHPRIRAQAELTWRRDRAVLRGPRRAATSRPVRGRRPCWHSAHVWSATDPGPPRGRATRRFGGSRAT